MDTDRTSSSSTSMLPKLVSHLKLLPLIESCEAVWPSRLDLQLMAPTYETDFRKLRLMLECDPTQMVQASEDEDMLRLQTSFISCCYESTAFILSEELALELQALRDEIVWDKLMVLDTSKELVSRLFAHYRKSLLGDDWFYQFGDVSSFCGFVWDLVAFDQDMKLIDRNAMDLIERVCFRLMQSPKIQLFVKGVTVLEECIHKARGHSLVDYETVYKELGRQTRRMSEDDERMQNAYVVLLTAMLECVRVLEVDRNQLMTLISNFTQYSRADHLMGIVLKGLNQSTTVGASIALMDILLQLLAIDHDGVRVVPDECADEYTEDEMNAPLIIMNEMEEIDTSTGDWWRDITEQNKGRSHRWTRKLFRSLASEVEKFENLNVTHFQHLAYAMFFAAHCGKSDPPEQIETSFQLMVTFVQRMVNRVESMVASGATTNSTLKTCMQLTAANVACAKDYERFVPVAETGEEAVGHFTNYRSQSLNKLLRKVQRW